MTPLSGCPLAAAARGGSSSMPSTPAQAGCVAPRAPRRICLALLFVFRHFVGNFVENFVENLAEFDGLFSNMNRVDEVSDNVSDKGTKRLTTR